MASNRQTSNIEVRVFRSRAKIPVIVLVPLMLMTTVYCLAYFYINSNWMLDRLPQWLHAGFGGDFAVSELVVEPTFGTVHLYGVEISRDGGERTIIDAPEVHASADPTGLLNRRIVLDEGRVRGADVYLAFDDENNMNLLEALGIDPPEEPVEGEPFLSVGFPNLQCTECRLEFVREEFKFVIPEVTIPHGEIAIDSGDLKMSVDRLDVQEIDFRFYRELFGFEPGYGDWTFTVNDLSVRDWRWRNNGFNAGAVNFQAEGGEVQASGRMEFPNEPGGSAGMRYNGTGKVSIPYWSPLVQYFIQDTVHFHVPEAEIGVEGSLEWIDGVFRAEADVLDTAGLTFTDVSGKARLEDQRIYLQEGEANFHGGEIDVQWAYFDMFNVSYGGIGRFKGVDPASMLRDLDVDVPALAGSLSGGVEVWGAVPMMREFDIDDPLPLYTDSQRELADVTVTTPWQFDPVGEQPLPTGAIKVTRGSRIQVDYDRVRVFDTRLRSGADRVDVENFELDYIDMELESATEPHAVDVSLNIDDIGPYLADMGVSGTSGRLVGNLQADGPLYYPEGSARLSVSDVGVRFGGELIEGEGAEFRARLDDGLLRVDRFDVDSGVGSLQANGRARLWGGARQLAGSYDLAGVRLDVVDRVLNLQLGAFGEVDAEGQFEGTVDRPEVGVHLTMGDGGIEGVGLRDLEIRGGMSPERWSIDELGFRLQGGGTVRASGFLEPDSGAYRADLAADGVDIGGVGFVADLPRTLRPKGLLAVDLQGRGNLKRPGVGGDLVIDNLGIGGRSLGDVAIVIDTVDSTVYVEGAIPSVTTIALELPMAGDAPMHVELGMDRLDVAGLLPELEEMELVQHLRATGTVDLYLEQNLSDYLVTARMDEIVLETPSQRYRTDGPVAVGLDSKNRLQIDRLRVGSDGRYVSVQGGVNLESWLTTLKVEGQLELDLIDVLGRYVLDDMLPETLVDASGVADVDLRIEGPSGRPKPIGTVEFNQASFVLRGFPEPIRIQSGAVVFGRDALEIPEDRALVGEALGGVYSLSGNVAMDGYRPGKARLNLWSHNMMYRMADTANVSFDTDLQVNAGQLLLPRTWEVAGQINVLNALYYRNISLLEQELAGRVIGAFSRQTERYEAGLLDSLPWLGDVQFNVDIRARDGVEIENRIDRFAVDLGMRLDLKLQQTLRDPRLTGEIDVLDGEVRFQGETFEVRSGTIEYLGSATNPRVGISAGADIRNRCAETVETQQFDDTFSFSGNFGETERELYHVLLNVQGRLESLDIQLESNPYADQRDILSLMLTGCTVDALTASNASQPGLEIALGPLLGRLEKEVRDVVKLSEFTIMPGIERTEVRIGDRLTRRLVWRFQLDTGLSETAGGQRYQLEYQLSDRWSAELSERSRGETNNFLLDLKLKYRLPLD